MEKNEAKAQAYNTLVFQYSRLEEQIRLIRAENFELSKEDIEKINRIKFQQELIMTEVKKMF